ncbi:membrane protease YdiL (CAAX protease family) [Microbacterium keratanolyticum]|uniref:CAAX prenyl protease 2/Lysostaphin resistance protein A-like domain-containing protein n=1 Tax=Microbacterium keratanolyticum TaxID=67574 RepID=A0A9W6M911_9MICO|nr:CPBP family intramembrane glutamic endopeptidase [Microbacterium keratanolyticum]MBM7470029.1 membrane protease YdiL (CAAX protease family) [Microbacterium keratanolyticum]GLK02108.1 hypothetical protein GCM10017596_18230 [Microbacterium keratanolyticum]
MLPAATRPSVVGWPWFLGLYLLLTLWIILGRALVPEALFAGIKNSGYVAVMLVGVWMFRDAFTRSWQTTRRRPFQALAMVAVAIALMGVASAVSQAAILVVGSSEPGANQSAISSEVLAASASLFAAFLFVGLGGLVAPVVEELVFREIPFGRLRHVISTGTAMILSCLVFTAIHIRGWDEWPLMLLYAGYAVALASAYLLSGRNLLACITAHALWNGIGLVFLLVSAR